MPASFSGRLGPEEADVLQGAFRKTEAHAATRAAYRANEAHAARGARAPPIDEEQEEEGAVPLRSTEAAPSADRG